MIINWEFITLAFVGGYFLGMVSMLFMLGNDHTQGIDE